MSRVSLPRSSPDLRACRPADVIPEPVRHEDPIPLVASADQDPEFPERDLGYGVTAQVVVVTPELAGQWLLKLRSTQRPERRRNTAMIARDLQAGLWKFTGEPIIFDSDGMLIDGQHRLLAIVQSGIPAQMVVTRGVPPDGILAIDIGARRSAGNALAMEGHVSAVALAAAARIVYLYENGMFGAGRAEISAIAVDAVVAAHPRLGDSVAFINSRYRVVHSIGVGAGLHYLFSLRDPELADHFAEQLESGEELKRGDPVLALRRRLLDMKKRAKPELLVPLMIKTWNALRAGRSVSLLIFGVNEKFPEIL